MSFTTEEFPNSRYYTGDLREVINRLREIDIILDSYEETVAELRQAIVDIPSMKSDIALLKNRVANITSDVLELIDRVDNNDNAIANIRRDIEVIKSNIQLLESGITAKIALTKAEILQYVKTADADLDERIVLLQLKFNQYKYQSEQEIEDIWDYLSILDIKNTVYNPLRTEELTLEKNNDAIYADLRDDGLTNIEYDMLDITNDKYQAYNLTNYEFGANGKEILGFDKVFVPMAMEKVRPEVVPSMLLEFIYSTPTNDEFAALDLTNDIYAQLDWTNNEYMMRNFMNNTMWGSDV